MGDESVSKEIIKKLWINSIDRREFVDSLRIDGCSHIFAQMSADWCEKGHYELALWVAKRGGWEG